MGINSTATAYNFGQLGSAHLHNDAGTTLTPPDGMVIVAIQFLAETQLDVLTCDTSNSLSYGGTNTNRVYFGQTNSNVSGNSETTDSAVKFPQGLTIYGRWTQVSLAAQDTDGGIVCYFGY
jgi:hypothetical protein|tara:strand:- start:1298 stop:1660 length:363 start_codon:yes stop_codon:yes gene_type:complete